MSPLLQRAYHYPLVSTAISFAAGISTHFYFPLPPDVLIIPFVPLVLAALLFLLGKNNSLLFGTVLFIVFLAGFMRAEVCRVSANKDCEISSIITRETDVILSGTLQSMILFNGDRSVLLIKSNSLRIKGKSEFINVRGLVQLRLFSNLELSFKPGEELLFRCRLSPPYRFNNPGGFDYPAFLAERNIHITGYIDSPAHIHKIRYRKTIFRFIRYLPENIRLNASNFIKSSISEGQADVFRALVTGDRSGIDHELMEIFKNAGIMHIFAVSGLHLSIVATSLFFIVYWLLGRSEYLLLNHSCKRIALLATIPPLILYSLLTGLQIPVFRALVMVILFIISFALSRHYSPFTTLSCAGFVILAFNPASLFSVSFQLSFAAVASLLMAAPSIAKLLKPVNFRECGSFCRNIDLVSRWIGTLFLISLTATIATAPILIYNFNRISIVGPLANLILEPVLCMFSLPLGLLAVVLHPIFPQLGAWLLHAGGAGITAAVAIADYFSSLPFSTIWLATPSPVLIITCYAALLLCFCGYHRFGTVIFLAAMACFFYPPREMLGKFSKTSEIVFLDVGKGSSTLIIFPGGKKILVDAGGASSRKFNVGESVIAPYLWNRGYTKLDGIIITHPDADHYNGTPFLMRHFKPEILYINEDCGHDSNYDELLILAEEQNVTIKNPMEKQTVLAVNQANLEVLANPLRNDATASSNNRSIVLRFKHAELSCIIPGDIEIRAEKAIIEENKNIESAILLSPHHGSRTSSSVPFLKEVNPDYIVVSAGRFQPDNFPCRRIRSYSENNNIKLLNTSEVGAITADNKNGILHIATAIVK